MWLLPLAVALPLLLSGVAARPAAWWTPGLAALPALVAAFVIPLGEILSLPWILLGMHLGLDETTRLFLFFTAFLWAVGGITASEALRQDPAAGRFRVFFLLAMSGNLLLVVAQDLVSFYTGFAMMGIASYALVIHEGHRASLRAGKIYLILTLVGELALFVALVLIASQVGLMMPDAADLATLPGGVIALVILGFGIKAGLVPAHFWAPLAYPAAPIAAAAMLSGAMSKTALLGWLRFLPLGDVALPAWGTLLIFLGLVSMFYALTVGLLQSNPRVILAYSSISKAGLFVLVLGIILIDPRLAPVGTAGLVLYATHHALVKGGLFLGLGLRRPDRDPDRTQVWVLAGLVLLAVAMAGGPLTSGAIAKDALKPLLNLTDWGWLETAVMIAAVLTTLLMIRFLFTLWSFPLAARPGDHDPLDPSSTQPASLAVWAVLVGIVAIMPFVFATPGAWLTNWNILLIAFVIAWPLLDAARHHRGLFRPLQHAVPPGDLVVPLRALRIALVWSGRQALRRLARGLARPQTRLTAWIVQWFGPAPADPERSLRDWATAGLLWLVILVALLLALVLTVQNP
ncbi:hypothetical protein CKO25_13945 [Thiocapsa imhoffii]|uniref:NADH:quinone oxidoreductase/Mrp antiporter transmembrane domain-containing protein n=1 Tax=Thiocapsa imhoffii TaxID=382777 RepID=A0A9X0WJ66_9GAMM|nr:hypothetical protein [Thiocapsa imhoffii]